MDGTVVHPHALKHGLTEQDVLDAWEGGGPRMPRSSPNEDEIVGIGWTRDGRAVQLVAVIGAGGVLIIHAMTPPTNNVLRELGVTKQGRR